MAQTTDQATSADVFYAYRLILGREPDAPGLTAHVKNITDNAVSVANLRADFMRSNDFLVLAANPQAGQSVFLHYDSCFDADQVIRSYEVQNLGPTEGYLTNFLGVLINPKFFPSLLAERAGTIDHLPIPSNWHADMAEWAAVLRAVDLSHDHFTMIELGCGWGCWMNNTGVAARRAGRLVHLIGVEGDAVHFSFAEQALSKNGFSDTEVTLHRGIAASTSGMALFPQANRDGHAWGGQPKFGVSDAESDAAVLSGEYDALRMFSFAELAGSHEVIDLLHIDIQGGEADFIDGSIEILSQRVRYIVIGTHSRSLEGRLFDTMLSAGWKLEIERPGLLHLNEDGPFMHVDGVQGWRNRAL